MIESRADLLDRVEEAEEATAAARADAHEAREQVADVLVVLARWGVDIDSANPAVLVEVALRDALAAHPLPRRTA